MAEEIDNKEFLTKLFETMYKELPLQKYKERFWKHTTFVRAIIHRCKRCGKLSSNRVAADDNPMKLMSIAMKPLCSPPFPLDYSEEMTALMGGDGRMR